MNKEFGINDWRNALFESSLSPKAKLVALALARYYRQGKECYPSYSVLREDTGYTNNHTIIDAINELKESGFIKVKKGGIKNLSIQANSYEFVGVQTSESTGEVAGELTGESTGEVAGESTGELTGEKNAHQIREEVNKLNKGSNKEISSNELTKKVKKFIPPTVDEIEEYCRTSGYQIDVNHFCDHYESNGWKVGKNPMKDWRAAVRNWVRGQGSGVKRVEKPDLAQQNRANLWAFVQDSGVKI